MKKNLWRIGLIALLAVRGGTLPRPSFSQVSKGGSLEYQVSVTAISIAVAVQDKGGRYIDNLTRKDFAVFENNVPQTISYFQHDDAAPVSLTVLLDVSGSMALDNKLADSKIALRELVTHMLRPQDEVSLLIFAEGEVEVAARFSKDKMNFLVELEKVEPYGKTALNDAVAVSPEFANRGNNQKRLLLLITDGIENDSQLKLDQTLEIARRVDVPIQAVGYKIPLSDLYLEKYKRAADLTPFGITETLERFSAATGGKAFFVNQPEELTAALRDIHRDLSQQYIIGYTSHQRTSDEYRKILVVTPKKKYRVRTRAGY